MEVAKSVTEEKYEHLLTDIRKTFSTNDMQLSNEDSVKIYVIPLRAIRCWRRESKHVYRVTIHVVPNLSLTSKQKFCFSMRPM